MEEECRCAIFEDIEKNDHELWCHKIGILVSSNGLQFLLKANSECRDDQSGRLAASPPVHHDSFHYSVDY